MADEPQQPEFPPLVLRAEPLPADAPIPTVLLAEPLPADAPIPTVLLAAPPKPRSRFLKAILWCLPLFEAIVWCLVFLAVQTVTAVAVIALVFVFFMMGNKNPKDFAAREFEGLSRSVSGEGGEQPQRTILGQTIPYSMLFAQLASLGLIAVVFPRRIGRDWRRQIAVRRPAAFHLFIVVLVLPGFMVLASGIGVLLKKATGLSTPVTEQGINALFNGYPPFLTFLTIALGPGCVEELWCRGFLGRRLTARYGLIPGVLLTSAMFGLLHVDPAHAFVAAMMGLCLHFVYIMARSIWAPVLLHALNNGFAVLSTLVVGSQAANSANDPSGPAYLWSVGVVFFGSVALWTSRARVVRCEEGQGGESAAGQGGASGEWKPEYPCISVPPPETGLRLTSGRPSPMATVFTVVAFAALMACLL